MWIRRLGARSLDDKADLTVQTVWPRYPSKLGPTNHPPERVTAVRPPKQP